MVHLMTFFKMEILNDQIKRALSWTRSETQGDETDLLTITKIYGGASASILELAGLNETFHIEKIKALKHKIVISSQDCKKIVIILINENL